jgi:hypothetical protein
MKWKPDKSGAVRKRERNARLKKIQLRKDFAKNMEGAEALAQDFYTGIHTAYEEVNEDSKFSRLGLRNTTRDVVNKVNACKKKFDDELRKSRVSEEDMALADKVLEAYTAWRKMTYPHLPVSTQTLPGTVSGVSTARASVDGSWELLARMQELRSMRV